MSGKARALEISAVILLIASLTYVAGWSYAYHWYDRFNLGLVGLGVPFEYHFMYGFWVILSFWWLMLFVAVLLMGAFVLWKKVGNVIVLTTPLWVPVLFFIFYYLGDVTAISDYRDHRNSHFDQYPLVRLWADFQPSSGDLKFEALQKDLVDGKYRLLLQTDQCLYLIKPVGSLSEVPILQVQVSQVRALRLIPTNPGDR